MHSRYLKLITLWCAILVFSSCACAVLAQTARTQSDASPAQRLEVMRSRLEGIRRSLNGAISAMNASDTGGDKKAKGKGKTPVSDDPGVRLRGLEKEAGSLLSEVNDLRSKVDRSERVEPDKLDRLETSVTDLDTRAQSGLQATASLRSASTVASSSTSGSKKKKKGRLFGLLGGGDSNDKYEELTGTVAAGRDRVLFEDAVTEVRKGNYDTGRLLFNTIITTYPDSAYLPLAKLAIADSFYLEGSTSSLIQAASAYQDWLTFFPTDPLADDAMLKIAESEMRQMGLANRDVTHARKAEQRLKVILQQFPNSALRPEVEMRLKEVQENLGMHNLQVARFYYERNENHKGGLKGAQSRLREIVEKYPFFSYLDEVLFRLGVTYMEEEEPDEAAKYFQQVVRDYPNSEFVEKSRDQLTIIGAPIPDPDPIKKNMQEPVRPSFTQKLMQEVAGTADVTVDKDGVLISKDRKSHDDLIDIAARNGGLLPATTPDAPIHRSAPLQRTPPAKQIVPPTTPAATPAQGGSSGGLKIQPTQPGPPADTNNPVEPSTASPGVAPRPTPIPGPTNTAPAKP
ncbi:MAG TPA: outer membrane protein assembly factor BamD [Pyrinomonadaceae bacterium]|jgi:outer membrane protein assembly factor BamD|nr:outer membrane protein assembly factor BamD [Pyrinomonadaceae bacterium]